MFEVTQKAGQNSILQTRSVTKDDKRWGHEIWVLGWIHTAEVPPKPNRAWGTGNGDKHCGCGHHHGNGANGCGIGSHLPWWRYIIGGEGVIIQHFLIPSPHFSLRAMSMGPLGPGSCCRLCRPLAIPPTLQPTDSPVDLMKQLCNPYVLCPFYRLIQRGVRFWKQQLTSLDTSNNVSCCLHCKLS